MGCYFTSFRDIVFSFLEHECKAFIHYTRNDVKLNAFCAGGTTAESCFFPGTETEHAAGNVESKQLGSFCSRPSLSEAIGV